MTKQGRSLWNAREASAQGVKRRIAGKFEAKPHDALQGCDLEIHNSIYSVSIFIFPISVFLCFCKQGRSLWNAREASAQGVKRRIAEKFEAKMSESQALDIELTTKPVGLPSVSLALSHTVPQ
jgi:hypothetical protein